MATKQRTEKYDVKIRDMLLSRSGSVSIDEFAAAFPGASIPTVRKRIQDFLCAAGNREFWSRVAGVLPTAKAVLDAVEADMGHPIRGADLWNANLLTKAIIESITNPANQHFLREMLHPYLDGESVNIPFQILEALLRNNYATYLTRVGNGLVSIAGTLNQSLLVRALRNDGLDDAKSSRDFAETGNKSAGDIQIYHHGLGRIATLGVEAKSYAARERLLRGLQDIDGPKVGVGFFTKAAEFNVQRTRQFIEYAHASAIYLPQATYNELDPKAKDMRLGTMVLYRPLEKCFTADMRYFVQHGELPDYANA